MNRIIISVLLFLITTSDFNGQPTLNIFKDYTPKWIHATFDTTALNIVGYHNATRLRNQKSIMFDGNIYTLYKYNLQNKYGDGGYIEKINALSGQETWRAFYDIRSIDINERPNGIRLNNMGEIEVAGGRFLERKTGNSATPYNTLVIRKYDSETGELLNWNITDPQDSLNTRFYNAWDKVIYFHSDDVYRIAYTSIGQMWKYLPSFLLDTSGYLIKHDTLFFDHENDYQETNELLVINDSTLVSTLHTYDEFSGWDIPLNIGYHLKVLNWEMEEIKSIDMSADFAGARNRYMLELAYADDKYYVISYANEPVLVGGIYWHYFFYDYNGNCIDSIDLYENKIVWSKIKRISEDEFIIVGTDGRSSAHDLSLHFYRKKLGEPIELLRKIEMRFPDRLFGVEDMFVTENKDIVLVGGYHEFNRAWAATFNLFPITVCFSAEDIDITSTCDQIVQVPELIIHPNPTTHSITISHSYEGEARIEVLDLMGRVMIGKTALSAGEDELAVSVLNAGVYVVRLLDRRGVVVGRGKFIRR